MQFIIELLNHQSQVIPMEVKAYILDNLKAGLILGNNDIHCCSINLLTNGTMQVNGIELQVEYTGNEVNYHVCIENQGKGTDLYTKQACFPRQKQGLSNVNSASNSIESKAYRSTNWCKNCRPPVPTVASNTHLIQSTTCLTSCCHTLGLKTSVAHHLTRPWRSL